jgi:quercetin dioxygenase-like cupin family protein
VAIRADEGASEERTAVVDSVRVSRPDPAASQTALVGARVMGEHRHPALVERFTVLEGELTVKRDGQTSVLGEGETAVVEPGVWHDWWNASDRDARVRVEVTLGERLALMIETVFGLAPGPHRRHPAAARARRAGVQRCHRVPLTAPGRAACPLRRARSPGPLARHRATYPQLSGTVVAPRT